jgi:hypothetical protein
MARVTADEVKEILDNCTLSDTIIGTFIDSASSVVDENLSDDSSYSDELLAEIEKYLAAHLISSTVNRITREERVGDASVVYTGRWGELLKATPYGHIVILLDKNGKLLNLGKTPISITAIKSFDDEEED